MDKFLAPEPIGEGDVYYQWVRFKREFEQFLLAVGKGDASGAVKLAIFLRVVGPRINDLYESMAFADGEDGEDFSTVAARLDILCARRSSKHVLRDRFFQTKQEGRSIDQFLSELRKNAKACEFGVLKDDLMLHVLIRGLDSERMRRRLFETDKLELSKAIQMCQTMEATAADLQLWADKGTGDQTVVAAIKSPAERENVGENGQESSSVAAVKERYASQRSEQSLRGEVSMKGRPMGRECARCGRLHKPRQCPAYGQTCHKCQRLHHFARKCLFGGSVTHVVEGSEEGCGLQEVLMIKVKKVGKKLLAEMQFVGQREREFKLVCQLDSAASCNVLAYRDYQNLGKPRLERSCTTLTMYDGSYNVEDVHLTGENRVTREWIVREFPDLFQGIGCLPGEYDIELEEGVSPVQNRPRKIPHVMKAAVEEKLKSLEEYGVIARVDTPTPWISNLTTVWKADKKQVRVCLDPRDLNKAICRNHFGMPTLDDVLPQLNNARIFSLLDAKDGFLHIKLSERSSFLTAFWGPNCRYRWLRLPFGLSSAPEEFQRRLQGVLHGVEGIAVVADDILVFGTGNTEEEARLSHDARLIKLLERAREVNLKFNQEKLRLHLTELAYIGHHLSKDGIKPDPNKVAAVRNMPQPRTVQDVRRFLGMCNYLSRFMPTLSKTSEPLRHLLEEGMEFRWTDAERKAFEELKQLISADQLLRFYDVRKPVVIQCDASREGLGATLLQEGQPVVSASSRSLTKSEQNYVALELECLAIIFACGKFDQYIYGKRLQRYDLDIVYLPGEQQVLADTLSRAPVESSPKEVVAKDEVFNLTFKEALNSELNVIEEREFIPISDQRWIAVKEATKGDEELKVLQKAITYGWPDRVNQVAEVVQKYWNFQDLLTVQDGVVYKGCQVVVPSCLREDFLRRLHSSHQGFESTLRRARDVVYWPGMSEDIKRVTTSCRQCEENLPAQPRQSLLAHDVPDKPWSKIGMDIFRSKGKNYLVLVDYLTDYFEICELQQTLAVNVIQAAKEQFARHGVPVVVQSDGGPEFMSREFQVFAKEWEFVHTVSSPYNSPSNGKAESAVKIAKRLIKKSADPYMALLEWRNTPTIGMGSSPNQRLFSRRTRGAVITSTAKLQPELQQNVWEKKTVKQRQMLANQQGRNAVLPPLRIGQPVLVQDMLAQKTQWNRGRCVSQLSPRSYMVEVEGQLLRRNRGFLRPTSHGPDTTEGGIRLQQDSMERRVL
ncbi:hypothetical protein EMCRGX_G006398 [Ephydatia muelleri]